MGTLPQAWDHLPQQKVGKVPVTTWKTPKNVGLSPLQQCGFAPASQGKKASPEIKGLVDF